MNSKIQKKGLKFKIKLMIIALNIGLLSYASLNTSSVFAMKSYNYDMPKQKQNENEDDDFDENKMESISTSKKNLYNDENYTNELLRQSQLSMSNMSFKNFKDYGNYNSNLNQSQLRRNRVPLINQSFYKGSNLKQTQNWIPQRSNMLSSNINMVPMQNDLKKSQWQWDNIPGMKDTIHYINNIGVIDNVSLLNRVINNIQKLKLTPNIVLSPRMLSLYTKFLNDLEKDTTNDIIKNVQEIEELIVGFLQTEYVNKIFIENIVKELVKALNSYKLGEPGNNKMKHVLFDIEYKPRRNNSGYFVITPNMEEITNYLVALMKDSISGAGAGFFGTHFEDINKKVLNMLDRRINGLVDTKQKNILKAQYLIKKYNEIAAKWKKLSDEKNIRELTVQEGLQLQEMKQQINSVVEQQQAILEQETNINKKLEMLAEVKGQIQQKLAGMGTILKNLQRGLINNVQNIVGQYLTNMGVETFFSNINSQLKEVNKQEGDENDLSEIIAESTERINIVITEQLNQYNEAEKVLNKQIDDGINNFQNDYLDSMTFTDPELYEFAFIEKFLKQFKEYDITLEEFIRRDIDFYNPQQNPEYLNANLILKIDGNKNDNNGYLGELDNQKFYSFEGLDFLLFNPTEIRQMKDKDEILKNIQVNRSKYTTQPYKSITDFLRTKYLDKNAIVYGNYLEPKLKGQYQTLFNSGENSGLDNSEQVKYGQNMVIYDEHDKRQDALDNNIDSIYNLNQQRYKTKKEREEFRKAHGKNSILKGLNRDLYNRNDSIKERKKYAQGYATWDLDNYRSFDLYNIDPKFHALMYEKVPVLPIKIIDDIIGDNDLILEYGRAINKIKQYKEQMVEKVQKTKELGEKARKTNLLINEFKSNYNSCSEENEPAKKKVLGSLIKKYKEKLEKLREEIKEEQNRIDNLKSAKETKEKDLKDIGGQIMEKVKENEPKKSEIDEEKTLRLDVSKRGTSGMSSIPKEKDETKVVRLISSDKSEKSDEGDGSDEEGIFTSKEKFSKYASYREQEVKNINREVQRLKKLNQIEEYKIKKRGKEYEEALRNQKRIAEYNLKIANIQNNNQLRQQQRAGQEALENVVSFINDNITNINQLQQQNGRLARELFDDTMNLMKRLDLTSTIVKNFIKKWKIRIYGNLNSNNINENIKNAEQRQFYKGRRNELKAIIKQLEEDYKQEQNNLNKTIFSYYGSVPDFKRQEDIIEQNMIDINRSDFIQDRLGSYFNNAPKYEYIESKGGLENLKDELKEYDKSAFKEEGLEIQKALEDANQQFQQEMVDNLKRLSKLKKERAKLKKENEDKLKNYDKINQFYKGNVEKIRTLATQKNQDGESEYINRLNKNREEHIKVWANEWNKGIDKIGNINNNRFVKQYPIQVYDENDFNKKSNIMASGFTQQNPSQTNYMYGTSRQMNQDMISSQNFINQTQMIEDPTSIIDPNSMTNLPNYFQNYIGNTNVNSSLKFIMTNKPNMDVSKSKLKKKNNDTYQDMIKTGELLSKGADIGTQIEKQELNLEDISINDEVKDKIFEINKNAKTNIANFENLQKEISDITKTNKTKVAFDLLMNRRNMNMTNAFKGIINKWQKINQKIDNEDKKNKGYVKIQTLFRGHKVRKNLEKTLEQLRQERKEIEEKERQEREERENREREEEKKK